MERREYGTGSKPRLRGKVWYIKFRFGGKQYEERTDAKNEDEARRLTTKRLRTLHAKVAPPPDLAHTTLGDLRALYLDVARERGNKTAQKRGTTSLADRLANTVVGAFGGTKGEKALASSVTIAQVSAYKTAQLDAGCAPATINRVLQALRRMYRLGMQHRRVVDMPHISLLDESKNVRTGFLEPGEFKELVAGLDDQHPAVADAARWAYLRLWRRENVLGMRWSWGKLTFEKGQLVGATFTVPGVFTKNGDPLTAVVRKGRALDVIRRRWAAKLEGCDFVFHRAGVRLVSFRKPWEDAAAAIGKPDLLFHDLRRSGARNLIRAGVPEPVCMDMGGWLTSSTFRRYCIRNEDDLHVAGDQYETFLDRAERADVRTVTPLRKRA